MFSVTKLSQYKNLKWNSKVFVVNKIIVERKRVEWVIEEAYKATWWVLQGYTGDRNREVEQAQ